MGVTVGARWGEKAHPSRVPVTKSLLAKPSVSSIHTGGEAAVG